MVSKMVASQLCLQKGWTQQAPPHSLLLPREGHSSGTSQAAGGLSLSQGQTDGGRGGQRLAVSDRGELALGGADARITQSLLFQTQGQAREQVLPLFGKLGPGRGDG